MKTAVIIGAGPAGLTAAYELLTRTDVKPVVLEASPFFGGISRTAVYRGNRMDIGGHRFFSKSSRVMQWWLDRMPLEKTDDNTFAIRYQGRAQAMAGNGELDPDQVDRVMLVRPRKSRIYWRRNLYHYPLSLSADTVRKMGVARMAKAGASYAWASTFPVKPETTLEDFLINRFGRELYLTFFKSYTEKVWGVACHEIPADWGAQRIKGLSIRKALAHALAKRRNKGNGDITQKSTETSLIERFLYPKFGPGQMWEITAEEVRRLGGEILMEHRATEFCVEGNRIVEVVARDRSGHETRLAADYVFSSMAIKDLFAGLRTPVPEECRRIAETLPYRDFITVGLLVDGMKLEDDQGGPVRDNWIYIQEPDVKIGRLQVFNNWSPYLVADRSKTWLGLEYFCYETDDIWSWPDEKLVAFGRDELARIDIIDPADAIDGCAIRVKKTYPAYFGSYNRFGELRQFLDRFENLYCVGRNGQHRYNNQDHSMLCAMIAVDHIAAGITDKAAVWDVNTEEEYHEEAKKG
ncbi:MAG: NAD(P)/FAD-dependent oxidoreductase [Planctomycetes bacterium]|nr:NAD(P)/FAD-dependent oxidoreductase [Planctomycetota bacterium]